MYGEYDFSLFRLYVFETIRYAKRLELCNINNIHPCTTGNRFRTEQHHRLELLKKNPIYIGLIYEGMKHNIPNNILRTKPFPTFCNDLKKYLKHYILVKSCILSKVSNKLSYMYNVYIYIYI